MLKIKKTLRVLLMALIILIIGCAEQKYKNDFEHKSGIYFKFPDGWSTLSKKEWQDMKLGKDKTLITIMDKSRIAGFSLIPVGLDANEQIVLGMLGDEPAARAVMFIESINTAGPNRYQEYELLEKKATVFAGAPMGEITFQGRNPGKTLKCYRVLVLAVPNTHKAILMLVFTAPMGKQNDFEKDFAYIESAWEWGK